MRRWSPAVLLLAGAGVLLGAVTIQTQSGRGTSGLVGVVFELVVYNAVPLLAGLVCVFNRRPSSQERFAWQLIGLGPIAWALGNLYYTAAFLHTPTAEVPFPSWADLGYLAFYPPIFAGLGLLARVQLVRFQHASWIDVLIATLSAGAVAAATVFHPVLESTGGAAAVVATNLAYPLGDVVLLALVMGALVLAGRRVTPSWILLSVGLVCFGVSDAFYLVRVSDGTYVYGSPIDLGWVVGVFLLATATVVRAPALMRSDATRPTAHVPAVFALVGLGIVTYDHFSRVDVLTLTLAVASLLAVVVRMTLSLLENDRLLRRTRVEAETDALTGLRNRRRLQLDLEAVLGEPHGGTHVLAVFDLDGFKLYNDTFGHPEGDELLIRLARRLAEIAGANAYRLGGDEFCILAPGDEDTLRRLRAHAEIALSEDGEGYAIRTSCGAALVPEEAATPARALRLADVRLYGQKRTRVVPDTQPQPAVAATAMLDRRLVRRVV